MQLGAYVFGGVQPMRGPDDVRLQRLRAAWPAWEFARCEGGSLAVPVDADDPALLAPSAYGQGRPCADGLVWLPPLRLPSFDEIARPEMPQPSVEVTLRRIGTVSFVLGLGPVYGCGPKRGMPSSDYGRLAFDLHQRARESGKPWTKQDALDTDRLLLLAFQQGYAMTEELLGELAPYDQDEEVEILSTLWGNNPKASGDAGPTSPPSPPV